MCWFHGSFFIYSPGEIFIMFVFVCNRHAYLLVNVTVGSYRHTSAFGHLRIPTQLPSTVNFATSKVSVICKFRPKYHHMHTCVVYVYSHVNLIRVHIFPEKKDCTCRWWMKVTLSENIFQDHAQLGRPKYGRNMKKHEQTTKRWKKKRNTFRKYYIPKKTWKKHQKGKNIKCGKKQGKYMANELMPNCWLINRI